MYNAICKYGIKNDLLSIMYHPGSISYGQWKTKVAAAVMTHEVHVWKANCLLYPSLKYYVTSIHHISVCSLWNLATVQLLLWERYRTALRLVCTCTCNLANRDQRCNLCDTFEPDTLEHIITRCVILL